MKSFDNSEPVISIIEKENVFYCLIDSAGIASKGASLEEAYEKAKMEFDLANEFCQMSDTKKPKGNNLFEFLTKTVIVCCFVFFTLVLGGLIGGVALGVGHNIVSTRISKKINKDLPQTENEKLEAFKAKLETFRPYIQELKKEFDD